MVRILCAYSLRTQEMTLLKSTRARKRHPVRAVVSFSLPVDDLAQIDEVAWRLGKSRSGLIRDEALKGVRRILRQAGTEPVAA